MDKFFDAISVVHLARSRGGRGQLADGMNLYCQTQSGGLEFETIEQETFPYPIAILQCFISIPYKYSAVQYVLIILSI